MVQWPLVMCSSSWIVPPCEPGTRVSRPWQPSDGYSVVPVVPPPCKVMMIVYVGVTCEAGWWPVPVQEPFS